MVAEPNDPLQQAGWPAARGVLPKLSEPIGIHDVIVRDALDIVLERSFAQGLDFFGGYAGIDMSALQKGMFKHNGSCSNQYVFLYNGMIHDNSAHPYQYVVVEGTPVDDGAVADGNIIADLRRCPLISAMDDRPVLYVHLIANPDIMHIAPDDGMEPYTAIIPHHHVPDDDGIFCQVTIRPELG